MKYILLFLFVILMVSVSAGNTLHHPNGENSGLPRGVTKLNGIDPNITNNHDLFPFFYLAQKASIFALGESAHGVAGYQNLQFRISKFLIQHFGYRKLLLEILSDDRALNHYLATGEGDLVEILYLNPWYGDDAEMKAFFEWVRSWNVAHPNKQVFAYVVDPQAPWLNAPVIKSFLSEFNSTLEAIYGQIIDENCFGAKFDNQIDWAYSPETTAYYATGTLPQNETDACFTALDELNIILEDNKVEIIDNFGYTTYYDTFDAIRSLNAWVLKSILLFFETADAIAVREKAFAESTLWKWRRGSRYHPTKAIFIAHHVHIAKTILLESSLGADEWTGLSPVGERIKKVIGNKYVAVANSGYNIKAMFNQQFPIPDSSESIDFTLAAYEEPWLVAKTSARWVKNARGGDWLVNEERIPNGRYYNLPTAFDRVVFHYNASAGVFLGP